MHRRLAGFIFSRVYQSRRAFAGAAAAYQKPVGNRKSIVCASTGLLAAFNQLLFNQDNEESIVFLLKRGLLAQARMQYADAEDFFHDAIKLFDKMNAKRQLNPVYRVNIYLYIANLYYESGDYERSFRLFQECLRELIANLNYERNHEAVIEISLKLSNIFAYGLHLVHDAKVGYEFCVEAIVSRIKEYELKQAHDEDERMKLTKQLANAKVLFVMILHTYGRYCLTLKDNEQALNLLEQSKILAAQLHEQAHVSGQQFGSLLNDTALAYYANKNYTDAIKTLTTALDYLNNELKQLEVANQDDTAYARAKFDLNEYKLVNLANLCASHFALKEYDKAKTNCTNALTLFTKSNFEQKFISKSLVDEINEIKKTLNEIKKIESS